MVCSSLLTISQAMHSLGLSAAGCFRSMCACNVWSQNFISHNLMECAIYYVCKQQGWVICIAQCYHWCHFAYCRILQYVRTDCIHHHAASPCLPDITPLSSITMSHAQAKRAYHAKAYPDGCAEYVPAVFNHRQKTQTKEIGEQSSCTSMYTIMTGACCWSCSFVQTNFLSGSFWPLLVGTWLKTNEYHLQVESKCCWCRHPWLSYFWHCIQTALGCSASLEQLLCLVDHLDWGPANIMHSLLSRLFAME